MKRSARIFSLITFVLFGAVLLFQVTMHLIKRSILAHLPESTTAVTTIAVVPTDWPSTLPVVGTIHTNRGLMLQAETAGVVSKLIAHSGKKVVQGEILIEAHHETESAQLEQLLASLPSCKANWMRQKTLLKRGATSSQSVEAAETEWKVLQARIKELQNAIQKKEIRAPFAGKLGRVQVQVGEYIAPGTAIVRLEDPTAWRFRSSIAQHQVTQLQLGQPLKLAIHQAGATPKEITGSVEVIEPNVDDLAGTLFFEAKLDPPFPDDLKSGIFVEAQLHLPTLKKQIVIPQEAVNFQAYGEFVYRVQPAEDGSMRATLVPVEIATKNGTLALVTKGLAPGDLVVVEGQSKLKQRSKVTVQSYPAASSTNKE